MGRKEEEEGGKGREGEEDKGRDGGSQRIKGEKWVGRSKGRVWREDRKEVG